MQERYDRFLQADLNYTNTHKVVTHSSGEGPYPLLGNRTDLRSGEP